MPIHLLTALVATACPATATTIPVFVRPLAPQELGAVPMGSDPARFRIGPFTYDRHGLEVTSDDPAFSDIVLDQRPGLRHRCGNAVDVPSVWNVPERTSDGRIRIEPKQVTADPHPGSIEARQHGVEPVLAGHRLVGSWPVYSQRGDFFLGLMRPVGGQKTTAIVAFRDVLGTTPVTVAATVPVAVDAITMIPDLHGPDRFVYLTGRDDRRLIEIMLKWNDDDVRMIADELSGPAKPADVP